MPDFLFWATPKNGPKRCFRVRSRNSNEARTKIIRWLLKATDHQMSRNLHEAEKAFLQAVGIDDPYAWEDNGYGETGELIE